MATRLPYLALVFALLLLVGGCKKDAAKPTPATPAEAAKATPGQEEPAGTEAAGENEGTSDEAAAKDDDEAAPSEGTPDESAGGKADDAAAKTDEAAPETDQATGPAPIPAPPVPADPKEAAFAKAYGAVECAVAMAPEGSKPEEVRAATLTKQSMTKEQYEADMLAFGIAAGEAAKAACLEANGVLDPDLVAAIRGTAVNLYCLTKQKVNMEPEEYEKGKANVHSVYGFTPDTFLYYRKMFSKDGAFNQSIVEGIKATCTKDIDTDHDISGTFEGTLEGKGIKGTVSLTLAARVVTEGTVTIDGVAMPLTVAPMKDGAVKLTASAEETTIELDGLMRFAVIKGTWKGTIKGATVVGTWRVGGLK